MCKANIEYLINFLLFNIDSSKSLSEWRLCYNLNLPKHQKLSIRELAFAFRIIKRRNLLKVLQHSTYYSFEPSPVHYFSKQEIQVVVS